MNPATALVAHIPGVAKILRDQAALMEKSMVGTWMRGDPRIIGGAQPLPWRIGQYAASMLAKRGEIGADASGLDARFEPPATVIFTLRQEPQKDADGWPQTLPLIEIARFTVPDHVMGYRPTSPALQIEREPMSATTHPIPDAALKQHTAILGKTGSGKGAP